MTACKSVVRPSTRRYTRRLSLKRTDGQKPSGYILHQDSDRVVIATGVQSDSSNSKTGEMIQIWILAAKYNPLEAIRRQFDSLVCGFCKHRGVINRKTGRISKRTCYVRMDTAPLGIWRGWQRGIYPYLPASMYADIFIGRIVRWGAYGDPYFVPRSIIRTISFYADAHTGYTHQWLEDNAQDLKGEIMASVDTPAEFQLATAMGWRTFRVRAKHEPIQPTEIVCPASIEATAARVERARVKLDGAIGPLPACHITCEQCKLCDGASGKSTRNIVINAHGAGAGSFVSELIQLVA